ncbi:MAG TPA: sarcosine oxidase subunit alpha family protein [Xanthobacteraceae bacterium]
MTSFRLSEGGLIDRGSPLRFTFDGRAMSAFAGDTLASALLANGQMLVGRSFKYHRPRGIVTAGAAEPNALATVGTGGRREPNTRATMLEMFDGLVAESQNRWPSLGFDIGALNGLLSPVLASGFYYKTFMWPARFWEKIYEPLIRRAAGLGRAGYARDPDRYEKCWAHCDLLVIGAGPTGLMAALTAARCGARVIIADEQVRLGGSLLNERDVIGDTVGSAWADAIAAELASLPNATVLPRTTVFGWYDSNVFGAVERVQKHVAEPSPERPVERLWRITARRAVLATGAEERPLVFAGNDRPGVMMGGAMRAYLNRFSVAPGSRVAVATSSDAGYRTAQDLVARGTEVAAIIDVRNATPRDAGGTRVIAGEVVATFGRKRLRAIEVVAARKRERLAVDALAMSGGYSPIIHLACQRGAKPAWNEELNAFLAPDVQAGLHIAGSAAGIYELRDCLRDGAAKAAAALRDIGKTPADMPLPAVAMRHDTQSSPSWRGVQVPGKAFVDFQNDVTAADLTLAVREGYGHVELAKRYTTTGMATDQGKLGNINAIGRLAGMTGKSPADIGTTTFRPFYTPVSFGALAGAHSGKHFQPVRRSPLHGWAQKNGAEMVEAGLWHRSAYFPRPGETAWRDSVDREVLCVRRNAGICDVSTLGKIEIFGPDAAEFLNKVYCNGFAKLPVGKARYGLMLREDGFIFDDGTTSRLGPDHFLMTTTTAQAGAVMAHLEFCAQVLWPQLDVRFASASDQWAQMAVAGPKSRAILQEVITEDISSQAFPYLGAAPVTVLGSISGRLFRISFSGELAYELAVPARHGNAVADAIMRAGERHGICAYGTEAMAVMRIEKGHVTHAELNGTVTPDDVGFGRMVSATKDFVGRAMLQREALVADDRLQLVGLKPAGTDRRMRAGAHLLARGAQPATANDQGHVTSACYSPSLGHHIALALLKGGRRRHGEEIKVWDGLRGEEADVIVCPPTFVDPDSARLHA